MWKGITEKNPSLGNGLLKKKRVNRLWHRNQQIKLSRLLHRKDATTNIHD